MILANPPGPADSLRYLLAAFVGACTPVGLWTLQPVPVVPEAAEAGHALVWPGEPDCPVPAPPPPCPEPVVEECPDVLSILDDNRTEYPQTECRGLSASGGGLVGLTTGIVICYLIRPLPWRYAGRRSRRALAGSRHRSPVRE